jgi:DNA-binding transcriptional ArsR family regulator
MVKWVRCGIFLDGYITTEEYRVMSDVSLWTALADPHRRAIVALLLERPRSVGEIVAASGLSQPGTSKHLGVLRAAGLVRVRQDAQRRVYALDPAPMAELDAWLAPYRKLWSESLDARPP